MPPVTSGYIEIPISNGTPKNPKLSSVVMCYLRVLYQDAHRETAGSEPPKRMDMSNHGPNGTAIK